MSTSRGRQIACFFHWGGQRVVDSNTKTFTYNGGVSNIMIINESTAYDNFVKDACCCLHISLEGKAFYHNAKTDKTRYVRVRDENGIRCMFYVNDEEVDVSVEELDSDILNSSTSAGNIGFNVANSNNSHTRDDVPLPSQRNHSMSESEIELPPLSLGASENLTITEEGQLFDNPSEFKQALMIFAAKNKFAFRFLDNSTKYYRIVCKVEACPWRLTAGCEAGVTMVRIKRFTNEHRHTAQDVSNYKPVLRSRQLGSLVKEKVIGNPRYFPRQICRDVDSSFSTKLTYLQGWRAKKKAKEEIDGKPADSYKLVPWMCKRLEESIPHTRAIWTSTEDYKFKQLFVAYGCSILGFSRGCRPIIFLDGCHLNGPYKGHLLSATAHDGDDGLYPLAYAIVSSENDEDWLWFLQNLQVILGGREVVIVTDRNHSLLNGIIHVFGGECNAWCLRHLKEKFSQFISSKKKMKGKRKKAALKVLDMIAYARTNRVYEIMLAKMNKFDPSFGDWVVKNSPHHWANALFPYRRWDKMYTNLAESFNLWVLAERELDILKFMITHAEKTTQLLLRKKTEVQSWPLPVGSAIEEQIKDSQGRSWGYTVLPASDLEFTVYNRNGKGFSVKLQPLFCSCLEWTMTGIPCPHACRAIQSSGLSIYDLVEWFLKKEAQVAIYEVVMSPVPTHNMPSSNDMCTENTSFLLLPPATKRPSGCPKRKRIESQFQDKRPFHCS